MHLQCSFQETRVGMLKRWCIMAAACSVHNNIVLMKIARSVRKVGLGRIAQMYAQKTVIQVVTGRKSTVIMAAKKVFMVDCATNPAHHIAEKAAIRPQPTVLEDVRGVSLVPNAH